MLGTSPCTGIPQDHICRCSRTLSASASLGSRLPVTLVHLKTWENMILFFFHSDVPQKLLPFNAMMRIKLLCAN